MRWIHVVLDDETAILVRANTNPKVYETLLSAGGLGLSEYWIFDRLGPSHLPGVEYETSEQTRPRRVV